MFTMKRNNWAQEAMRVHAEELLHWIPEVLGDDSFEAKVEPQGDPVNQLLEALSSGVALCRIAEKCAPASTWQSGKDAPSPDITVKFNAQAKPGSFQARDNIANFIAGCKALGMQEVLLFSSEDLIARKNVKQVLNCLLQLARIGAQNGVKPPQIVQFELDIDEHKQAMDSQHHDSDDEEQEVLIPQQFGLTSEELDIIKTEFKSLDQDSGGLVSRSSLANAIKGSSGLDAQAASNPALAQKLELLKAQNIDGSLCDLGEFLAWWSTLKAKEKPVEAPKENLEALPPASRPRGLSKAVHEKPEFKYLPYVPKAGDEIDEALAAEVNGHDLDIRIRRIHMKKKKKVVQGAYRIGTGHQPVVFMRLVRNLLMVRDGQNWEGVVRFIQRKMAEVEY